MGGSGNERKERVIHTRVPESLDAEIKRKAGDLGLSVSNLVRNVLQNAFGLVEGIVRDSAEIARSTGVGAGGEENRSATSGARAGVASAANPPAAPGDARPTGSGGPRSTGRVLGWQTAILNVNAVCEACNAILARGSRAAIGIVDGDGAKPFRCRDCLKEQIDDDEPLPPHD